MTGSAANGGGSGHKVLHNYHDHGHIAYNSEVEKNLHVESRNSNHRGKVTSSFPEKLHLMLSEVERSGLTDIVSWQPHGRCFVVHKPKEFAAEVMPLYFRQSKITSFQRQLNLYGFNRITKGPDRCGYYHELFLRHKAFLCGMMPRFRVKGTGVKAKSDPASEPDFYSMPTIKARDHASTKLNSDLNWEKTPCIYPFLHAKKQPENLISQIKEHVTDDNVNLSRRMASLAVDASNNVSQAIGYAKPCMVPPSPSFDLTSSTIRHQTESMTFRLSSYTRVSSDELISWAEPAYDDSLLTESSMMQFLREPIQTRMASLASAVDASNNATQVTGCTVPPSPSFDLTSSTIGHRTQSMTFRLSSYTRVSSDELTSWAEPAYDESLLTENSAMHFLREPILTPSASSSSLNAMSKLQGSPEVNTEAIFLDDVWGSFVW